MRTGAQAGAAREHARTVRGEARRGFGHGIRGGAEPFGDPNADRDVGENPEKIRVLLRPLTT